MSFVSTQQTDATDRHTRSMIRTASWGVISLLDINASSESARAMPTLESICSCKLIATRNGCQLGKLWPEIDRYERTASVELIRVRHPVDLCAVPTLFSQLIIQCCVRSGAAGSSHGGVSQVVISK